MWRSKWCQQVIHDQAAPYSKAHDRLEYHVRMRLSFVLLQRQSPQPWCRREMRRRKELHQYNNVWLMHRSPQLPLLRSQRHHQGQFWQFHLANPTESYHRP